MNTAKDLNGLRGIVAIQAIHVIGAGINARHHGTEARVSPNSAMNRSAYRGFSKEIVYFCR